MSKTIEVKLPYGFMNCGITKDNHFIANTNDSSNYDTIKFPLPKGEWDVKNYKTGDIVVLIDNRGWFRRFMEI
jgi:hypothetical protein